MAVAVGLFLGLTGCQHPSSETSSTVSPGAAEAGAETVPAALARPETQPQPSGPNESLEPAEPRVARVTLGLASLTCQTVALARPVVFSHDWRLDAWSEPALRDAAELLVRLAPEVRVRVEADDAWNDPNRGANVSARRAGAVADFLVAHGVARDRVEVRGFGDTRVTPLSGAPRRVRILVVDAPGNCVQPRPIDDADGDGIADAADACPNEAEDFDGATDTDGCPEPEAGLVALGCRELRVDQPLRFEREGTTLTSSSAQRIEALAELLRRAEFVRVLVVHERVRHDPRRREAPPNERANAVRDALVQAGVSPDRVLARVDSVLDDAPRDYEIRFSVYERSTDCTAEDPAQAR